MTDSANMWSAHIFGRLYGDYSFPPFCNLCTSRWGTTAYLIIISDIGTVVANCEKVICTSISLLKLIARTEIGMYSSLMLHLFSFTRIVCLGHIYKFEINNTVLWLNTVVLWIYPHRPAVVEMTMLPNTFPFDVQSSVKNRDSAVHQHDEDELRQLMCPFLLRNTWIVPLINHIGIIGR